jgi:eukaryotic-like serine/threonine-protein kinase
MSQSAKDHSPSEVRVGTRLGRYEILVPVAQGGMARVWAARQHGQRGFSKVVAIKTILPALARDANFEAMFLDEARLASGIHHPNVCEIFDLGEEAGTLYIAMEWVNGEALSRILKPPVPRGQKATAYRLDVRTAARIIADAAKGLHAAHELKDDAGEPLGVVHRDVSPQNILISTDGMVKVTDFGVAKALRPGHESTMAGQVKGKIAYMSPEQARGAAIDRRSDVFALGVVLYEITTGHRPFTGDNEIEVMKAIVSGYFEPPSALVPGYPRDLEAIVLWSMNLDQARRFPSADAMRHSLEDWLLSSGGRVTEQQIARVANERVGRIVEDRAGRIRERTKTGALDLAAADLTPPPPSHPSEASSSHVSAPSGSGSSASHGSAPSAVSHVAPMVATAPPPMSAEQHVGGASPMRTAFVGIGIGLGVFALIAVGGGGLYVIKKRHAAHAAQMGPPPAAPTLAPQPAATLPPTKVRLVKPENGVTLLVDGMVQPVGALDIPRPPAGEVKELTARAPGYEDKTFRIESGTETIDVTLEKADAAPEETTERPSEPAKATTTAKSQPSKPAAAPTAAKPDKPKDTGPVKIDVPDNPF